MSARADHLNSLTSRLSAAPTLILVSQEIFLPSFHLLKAEESWPGATSIDTPLTDSLCIQRGDQSVLHVQSISIVLLTEW